MSISMDQVDTILKKNLSEKAFELWKGIREKISNKCWDRLTSSTGKYHRKENGYVPTVLEHTFEMLYAADKIVRMFDNIINKDVIFLSIILHDSYKYGLCKTCKWTEERHDQITADIIKKNKKIYLQVLNESDLHLLENAIRFHNGKWSSDAKNNRSFNLSSYTPEVMFLHTLDMMSSQNLIKVIEENNDIIKNQSSSRSSVLHE